MARTKKPTVFFIVTDADPFGIFTDKTIADKVALLRESAVYEVSLTDPQKFLDEQKEAALAKLTPEERELLGHVEKPKRTRRTKAQVAADKAAKAEANQTQSAV